MTNEAREILIQISYMVSAVLFIYGLKMLGKPDTAVRGNQVSAVGMAVAIVATLLYQGMHFQWIAVGAAIGSLFGYVSAKRVPMTGMPQFVAFFNGTGGLSSLIVGCSEYIALYGKYAAGGDGTGFVPTLATYLSVLIGGVTFTGSMIAYLKLDERWMSGKPMLFPGQQAINALVGLGVLAGCVVWMINPDAPLSVYVFIAAIVASNILGVLLTIPIGGADMPVVISLLNSYSGLAACAAGFVLSNTVLIVAGTLVGASGIILTQIMCKAMNRSLANVLFGGFGATASGGGAAVQGEVKPIGADDAYFVLEAASSVVFVPGYGMAVSQAQHAVRELGSLLEANGTDVKFAIHPVAGRMPGHMNVLLAEASVPYEQLVEMDDINPIIETVDVAIVIGANDVVNPAAREDESSPIYGMPIINVDHAKTCFVLKRSMNPGFAGIDNPLFLKENTRMLFGDAKASITKLVESFKSA